jgi:surface protein
MGTMFTAASQFDQDISGWNVGNVTNMGGMFSRASSFNRDLSGWCVTNIATKPEGFDTGADAWNLARPVWGTCP